MAIDRRSSMQVLEKGHAFFRFCLQWDELAPLSLIDIGRFYLVLHPAGSDRFRLIAIGEKRLPGDEALPNRFDLRPSKSTRVVKPLFEGVWE
jgi:hypothetical protein